MSPSPETSKPSSASKSTAPVAESTAPVAAPVAAPVVEQVGTFQPGQKVKHQNGSTFIVRYQTPEGVALENVANLVHPSAIKPI